MAWDDAPPTAEDVKAAPTGAAWDSAPPTADEIQGKSVLGFAKNVGSDVVDTAKGLGHLASNLMQHPVDTTVGVATHLPGALVNEGKRIGLGELMTLHPVNAVEKFGNALYNKPLTTALDVTGIEGAAKKGLSLAGGLARGGEMASEAGNMASVADDITQAGKTAGAGVGDDLARVAGEAPKPMQMPGEAQQILNEGGAPAPGSAETAVPTGATFQDTVANLGKQIPNSVKEPMGQVGDFLSQKYGQLAQKPGWADTVAQYLKQHAQNMSLKNMGASPLQVKQMGAPAARDIGQLAMEKGITSPFVGSIGMEQKIGQMLDSAGQTIGGIRKIAAQRGAVYDLNDVMNKVKAALDSKYTQGVESGQKGSYMKALAELKRADPTAEGLSQLSTKLNAAATNANKLQQASGAISDVANEVSKFNNTSIKKFLSPKETEAYESALDDFGAAKKMKQFVARKEAREAGGRMGPGGGVRQITQNFLDSVGYRYQAKIADKLADIIKKNPNVASSPKTLFREYINQAEEALNDLGEGGQ